MEKQTSNMSMKQDSNVSLGKRNSMLSRRESSMSNAPKKKKDKDNERMKKSKAEDSDNLQSRPLSSASTDILLDSKKKKKKGQSVQGGHNVTFTVTIAKAIPRVDGSSDDDIPEGKDLGKKKKRIVEAPRPQTYYHTEYALMPEDDDPIKTDVVTFGMAAKIYTEKMEAKVLKTWQDGDLTWVAWTHCHNVVVTEDVLLKMFNHQVELRVWDTRDKLSTRAKFDRPKALRLPQSKGEDGENVGVKALVLKQSESFESMQPKRSYIDRPLPSQSKILTLKDGEQDAETGKAERSRASTRESKKGKGGGALRDMPDKLNDYMDTAGHSNDNNQGALRGVDPAIPPTADGGPLRSYSRLGKLIGATDSIAEASEVPGSRERESTQLSKMSRTRSQVPNSKQKAGLSEAAASSAAQLQKLKAAAAAAADDASSTGGVVSKVTDKGRKQKKAEAAAQAAQNEHARKYGICCININMAQFFATGTHTVTSRLDKSLPTLQDAFLTISLSGPLMSDEMRQKLNPMIIKVHSATKMPNTPLNYADLRLKCLPAFVKYSFFKQPAHRSLGREQDENIYWDDVNVVLTGTLDQSELREYLRGPPLEIEVHDRDRVMEKQKLTPTLFGDDLEDEKISNVGTVSSKRTLHNPFEGREHAWDPYGIAKFDLGQLLEGQKTIYLTSPIHQCPTPDPLGGLDSKVDGKLVGVAGSVDGPNEKALAPGHYMENNSMVKLKVEIACPLTTASKMAANDPLPTTRKCPYGRIVFRFDYKSVQLLQRLQSLVVEINAAALDLSHLPQHIIEAALSTYKLSLEQQESRTLDIVTGFQLLDGKQHLFILEGLRDGAVKQMWEALPKQENLDLEVLYHSDLCFHQRLYGPLDVDLCRIKLHEPLDVIVQQPLLYVRDMVPKPCFQALTKLDQLCKTSKMRDAVRNDLLPTAEMVVSMSREFGVPLTTEDFEELAPEADKLENTNIEMVDLPRTSRMWTPIDNINMEYMTQLHERFEGRVPHQDFINENKSAVQRQSEFNEMERSRTMPVTVHAGPTIAHNYSTQTLNSTEQAKEKVREQLSKHPDTRFTYCPEYHHSMTVVPVNVPAVKKESEKRSQSEWKTPSGWIYPGKKTMRESNAHSLKPHISRVQQLYEPWEENTLHANILQPTLERERHIWSKRKADMDLWMRPHPIFGKDEPATIHLAGQKLKEEKLAAILQEHKVWSSKVITDDTEMSFHRCAPETEMREKGFKSGNQLDRLQGILKNPPLKLALKQPGCSMKEIPPLNVVLNPSVDTTANKQGQVIVQTYGDSEEKVKGFTPGPFKDHSWLLDRNKIPVRDYRHSSFMKEKGHDFNVYHKERSYLHKQRIPPLSDKEYATSHLFRWPGFDSSSAPLLRQSNSYIIPKPIHVEQFTDRHLTQGTLDSGLGSYVKEQTAVESN